MVIIIAILAGPQQRTSTKDLNNKGIQQRNSTRGVRVKLDQNTLFLDWFVVPIRFIWQIRVSSFLEKWLKHTPVELNRYQSGKLKCCSWNAHIEQCRAWDLPNMLIWPTPMWCVYHGTGQANALHAAGAHWVFICVYISLLCRHSNNLSGVSRNPVFRNVCHSVQFSSIANVQKFSYKWRANDF